MLGISNDRWYLKYGVHLISVIIIFTAFFSAYLYLLSHEAEFYDIVSRELVSFGNSKFSTFSNIIEEKSATVEKDINNLSKIYNLYTLDTIIAKDPKIMFFKTELINKIEPDRLGFIILENSSKEQIFTINKNNYPIGKDYNVSEGYYGKRGSIIWKNELIFADYNLTMRTPLYNYKNKIIGYFRVGLKSSDMFSEINEPVILGDKKLYALLINIVNQKVIYSVQNDLVNYSFIKQNSINLYKNKHLGKIAKVEYKNGRNVLLYLKQIKSSNWLVVFYLDTANLKDHLNNSNYAVFVLALLFALVTILSVGLLFRRITKKSIVELSKLQKQNIALEQLKVIIDQSILEIQILVDAKGTIIVHNKNLKSVFGFTSSLINANIKDLFTEEEKNKIFDLIISKDIGEKEVFKSICKKKDGTRFNVSVEYEVFSFTGNIYYYIFIQDITTLIAFEKRLNETERIYHTLLGNLPGIAYRCKNDINWTMIFISNGCKELTGYDADELLNNNSISYSDLILEEYREKIYTLTEEGGKESRPFSFEYKILTKDKIEKWVYEKGIAIYDENGKIKFLEGFITDISDRKRFEEKLIANTERYLSIFENSAAGKTIMSPEGDYLEVNESFCKMLGYSKNEIIGKNYGDFTYPEDIIKSKNALKMTLDNKALNFHFVKRYIHKNGNIIYVKLSLSMQYDKNLNPLYLISDALDVTTEIKVKTELAESEERYKLLAESAQEGIFLLNNDFTLEFANYYAANIINPNIQPEELLINNKYPTIFNIPNEEFKKVIFEKKTINVDSIVKINGKKTYLETKLVPILDEKNKVKSILGIARDETESRYLLDKLDESTRMLNTVINSITQRIFWKDTKSVYMGCNLNFALDHGLNSVNDIIGKTDYDFHWKEFAESFIEDDKDVVSKGEPLFNIIEMISKADGTKIWVKTNKVPLKNMNGQIIGILGSYEDFTEKKISEEKLQETLTKLETSNKELEQFAYIASHDLQEPLRMVASYTQLLEQRYKDKLDENANQFINFAVDGAKRMQKLIDDLLEYSRVTTKGKEFANVNLPEVMGKVMVALSSKIHETGAVVINGNLPVVFGDEIQIVRLFQNLIDNSIKYSGGKQPTIFITAEDMEDKYLLKIKDNGIGIGAEFKEKIFEIFERLHSKIEYPGTGIGLSICRRIVERHGGRIWLDETYSDGALFCFTLNKGSK